MVFGYGATDGTLLYVPYDDWNDNANAIFEIPIASPTSAVKKLLPQPPIENFTPNPPSCAIILFVPSGVTVPFFPKRVHRRNAQGGH